jgi:uncharacterized protein (TIGR00297 family)
MIEIAIKAAICVVFALISVRYRILDVGGTVMALIIGGVIIFTGGIGWFFLLLIFFVIGSAATRYKHNLKRRRLHEGYGRKTMNVIANGSVPAILALFSVEHNLALPFVAAISVAMADTLASELGVLSDKAYIITNMKPVKPGTNGAISWLGEGMALIGALIISVAGYFLVGLTVTEVFLSILLALLGCHIDSVLGATFQGGYSGSLRGENTIITNSDVNLISIAITALIAFIIVEAF